MGLRLVELCQQVNVYGPVLTLEMQAETQRAHDLGIPVIFDQKRLEKTRPAPSGAGQIEESVAEIQQITTDDLRRMDGQGRA